MAEIKTLTQFSTAAQYASNLPSWLNQYDAQRLAAYAVYEDMYFGQLKTFEVSQLGSEDNPIYVPVPKAIIEAINRYLAVDWDLYVDPKFGTPEERAAAELAFRRLFKRENVWAKFATQKRMGLVRGDAFWHITANDTKAAGRRISINELDPSSYFPIYDVEDSDRLVGCHIVDIISEDGKDAIRRQTYRKIVAPDGSQTITSESGVYEMTGWDDRNGADPKTIKRIRIIDPVFTLPPPIDQIPVYQIKNLRNTSDPFGSSVMRGLERLAEGINQTISDEDLAIALSGLGVYVTDAPAPVDEDGQSVAWQISPGRVLELGGLGAKFERVTGVSTVEPSQTHAAYLEAKMREGASVPSIALGDVEVAAAESGIALYLRLQPLLAANEERETEMLGIYDQMLYDLQFMWFPAYEQINMASVLVSTIVGDPLPQNRADKIAELISLVGAGILPVEVAQAELAKLGYDIPTNAIELLAAHAERLAQANDPYAGRLKDEDGENNDSDDPGSNPGTGGA